jgi:FkbM family methyltransferase
MHLWRKLRDVHKRLHALEQRQLGQQRQLTISSRLACLTEARRRLLSVDEDLACYAQHGEELLLWECLGWRQTGFFVEIGAYDGRNLSNSYFFEKLGWRGILVEADPELANRCRTSRPKSIVIHAALGETEGGSAAFSMVRGPDGVDTLSFLSAPAQHLNRIASEGGRIEQVTVPTRSLKAVLDEVGVSEIDWISIDVEGNEMSVLKGADLQIHRPKIILIEDNSGDTSVNDFLTASGYRRELQVGCNDLYRCL